MLRPSESGHYQRMIGYVERFRDIAKNMSIAMRESPEDALDLLVLQFQAVQAGIGHLDLRELRKLLIEDPDAFRGLAGEVQETVDSELPTPAETNQLGIHADDVDEEDGEEQEVDAPAPPIPNFPQGAVRRSIELAIENRKSKKKDDSEAALRGAANRLQQVSPERLRGMVDPPKQTVVAALSQIRAWVESVRGIGE